MMPAARERALGVCFAASAFAAWGVLPVYYKAVGVVPPLELVAHRAVWSMLLLAVLLAVLRRRRAIAAALRERRTLALLAGSTACIAVTWLTFVWAIAHARVLEISLGYYINPLVSVSLGVLVLRERLSRAQGLAVGLAALGVANLAVQTTGLPWPALAVAVSFGFYGLIRKTTRLHSMEGLFLETLLLTPLALAYLIALGLAGHGHFTAGAPGLDGLIMLSGAVTAVPLIWFASGTRRIDLATVGFLQYIAPSGHFLLAVLAFGETFTAAHVVTFGCIWTACAVFSADGWRRRLRARRAAVAGG